jgi:hypothetical protein
MGLERRLIGVDLVEEEAIRIIAILHHVEPETPGFVPDRCRCIRLDSPQKLLPLVGPDIELDHQGEHAGLRPCGHFRMSGRGIMRLS